MLCLQEQTFKEFRRTEGCPLTWRGDLARISLLTSSCFKLYQVDIYKRLPKSYHKEIIINIVQEAKRVVWQKIYQKIARLWHSLISYYVGSVKH